MKRLAMKVLRRAFPFCLLTLLFSGQVLAEDSSQRHSRNYQSCLRGSVFCDASLLTASQRAEVNRAGLSRNYRGCLRGSVFCDRGVLTPSQEKQVWESGARHVQSTPVVAPACAENGSCYGDISKNTGRPKTVHVRGYYRKDGTYVRGHYRSKPRR